MVIILVAGVSAVGKTTFSNFLIRLLEKQGVRVSKLGIDDYYHPMPKGLDINEYKSTSNFDDPKFLDFNLLKQHVLDLEAGELIEKPMFEFKTESRSCFLRVLPPQVLIIEGTAALYFYQHYLSNLNMKSEFRKYFLVGKRETIYEWKKERNLRERGYTNEDVIKHQDEVHVWPTYLEMIEPTKALADVIVKNDRNKTVGASHPLLQPAMRAANDVMNRLSKHDTLSRVKKTCSIM